MALTKIDDRGLKTPIDLLDSESIRLGTGNDLQLYANGSNSYIQHSGDGDFYVQTGQTDEDLYLIAGSSVFIKPTGGADHGIKVLKNGGVELYYDGSKKFETTSTGVKIEGDQPKLRISSTNALSDTSGTENIGRIEFEGFKSSNANVAASIRVRQDGTWSTTNDWFSPTAIEFYTQDQSGTEITTPRLTLDSSGRVGIGKTPELAVGSVLQTKGNDGISFQRPGESLSTILRPLSSGLGLRLNYQDGDEILRVDNNGRLLLGTADDGFAGGLTTTIIGNASATNSGVTIASSPSNGTGRIHFADASSGTATYAGYIAYVHSSDSLFFGSGGNGTTALTLDSSQNATFAGNIVVASGKGIDFSATSDATGKTSELLDDYEEGTFTPVITGATHSDLGSYGRYVRVGKLVTISVRIQISASAVSGGVTVTGLPFTPITGTGENYTSGGITYYDMPSSITNFDPYIASGNSTIYFFEKGSGTQLTFSSTFTAKYLGFSAMYYV